MGVLVGLVALFFMVSVMVGLWDEWVFRRELREEMRYQKRWGRPRD